MVIGRMLVKSRASLFQVVRSKDYLEVVNIHTRDYAKPVKQHDAAGFSLSIST